MHDDRLSLHDLHSQVRVHEEKFWKELITNLKYIGLKDNEKFSALTGFGKLTDTNRTHWRKMNNKCNALEFEKEYANALRLKFSELLIEELTENETKFLQWWRESDVLIPLANLFDSLATLREEEQSRIRHRSQLELADEITATLSSLTPTIAAASQTASAPAFPEAALSLPLERSSGTSAASNAAWELLGIQVDPYKTNQPDPRGNSYQIGFSFRSKSAIIDDQEYELRLKRCDCNVSLAEALPRPMSNPVGNVYNSAHDQQIAFSLLAGGVLSLRFATWGIQPTDQGTLQGDYGPFAFMTVEGELTHGDNVHISCRPMDLAVNHKSLPPLSTKNAEAIAQKWLQDKLAPSAFFGGTAILSVNNLLRAKEK